MNMAQSHTDAFVPGFCGRSGVHKSQCKHPNCTPVDNAHRVKLDPKTHLHRECPMFGHRQHAIYVGHKNFSRGFATRTEAKAYIEGYNDAVEDMNV